MGNAASALHCRGFRKDHSGTTLGELPKVNHMPVIRDAVAGTVLTHRRDHQPVREGEVADP